MKKLYKSILLFQILVLVGFNQMRAQDKVALSFDGLDDHIEFNSVLPNQPSQTIEFWLKLILVPAAGTQVLVYNGNTSSSGYGLTLTNGKIHVLFGGAVLLNTNYAPEPGEWTHYTLVKEQAATYNWRLYINGVQKFSAQRNITTPAGKFKIGQPGELFAGSIDGIRVWNSAKTPAEIANALYCSLTPATTGITNYYDFSEGSPGGNNSVYNTLLDKRGTVNGTLFNFSLSGVWSNYVNGLYQYRFVNRLYVKANASGTNSGESWQNAFTTLQPALDAIKGAAGCGVFELWVAGGNYYPTHDPFGNSNPADPRDKTFYLPPSTSIYGGFAGTENELAERTKSVMAANPTILNGDIGATAMAGDNVYHVVLAAKNGNFNFLDGFTIKNGNANGSGFITVENVVVGKKFGGGMFAGEAGHTITNCVFLNNSSSSDGGAVYNYQSDIKIRSCVFSNNLTAAGGAGMFNSNSSSVNIYNSIFAGNTAATGGALFNEASAGVQVINSLLVNNTATSGTWGAVYNASDFNKFGNCILYNNAGGSSVGTSNIYYSIAEGALQAGANNSNANPQFVNLQDADGPDNIWMTPDDGLQLSTCSPGIDRGDNGSRLTDFDILGLPRRNDVPFITDGTGNTPVIDIGAYENQANFTPLQITGTISGAHTIPFPQELVPDYILSSTNPAPVSGAEISWEKNEENNGWVPATPAGNGNQYLIPELSKTTAFRRVVTICGNKFYSAPVSIKVVLPNGTISGRVLSKNGTPVKGIEIYVQKKGFNLPGSPETYRYIDTTASDGTYSVSPIYYGDPDLVPKPKGDFIIIPVKANHDFNFDTLTKEISTIVPHVTNVDFIDNTVFSITGKVYQECNDCLDDNGLLATVVCPLDSVDMYRDDAYFSKTALLVPGGEYGSYAASVTDPGNYKLEPKFKNHVFSPAFTNVAVNGDVANVNFKDVTTHTISGKLTAGCNDYIGTAVLEFTDIIPNDANGDPRTSCFRKRVTTNPGSGTYTITLPAGKYSVKVISFSPMAGGNVNSPDLLDFFGNKVPKDSLSRDITLADDSLNLVYQRPPVIVIAGLDNQCTIQPAANSFAVMQQGIEKTFTFKVYQGPVVNGFGCPVSDTTIKLFSNIQVDDINETLSYQTSNGEVDVTLKGGIPNIVAPYYKTFNASFTDIYNRVASVSKNVVVTGIKSNVGTFTTVSPELPLMVLHDPPGDNSSSFWSASKTAETALRFFTAQSSNINLWTEVKIGAAFSAGLGVSTESSVWGSIRGALDIGTRKSTNEETILTTTTTQNFATANNSDVVGAKGDVFIGAALNLLYSIANEVKYTPACSVAVVQKLIIANNGFATQYIYSEDHIRNTIIPTLQNFTEIPGVTTAQADSYRNQLKVWQQVLSNNEINKKNAIFDKNLSFDGSAGPISSTTTTKSTKSGTVDFNLEINKDLAIELGLEVAGSGASGGFNIAFKMETGSSVSNTMINETTTGYTLDDDDAGDYFSVNIKKDPVYNTPVFELVAATASCPPEEGAQPRDDMQLIIPVPSQSNIAADGEAEFILKLSNTSQSQEARTYKLQFIQGSNPNGAIVTIGGSPAIIPITYTIGYLGEVQVVVKVKRGASNIYSYEGLQFTLSDNCNGSISKTGAISVFFESTCSNIVIASPASNWVLNSFDNNILQVLFKDYTVANLTNVTLEYAKMGSADWLTGFTKTAMQLNNSANGTLVNWNVAGLADGNYNLRLKLNCAQGTVYSERVSGIIDRNGPVKFGKPQPTDDQYVSGDLISISYNEKIDVYNLANKVVMKRMSDDHVIPATVSGFNNQVIIVPSVDLSGFAGDSIRVVLQNIADQYGNLKSVADTFKFTVGTQSVATGPGIVTLSIANPVMAEAATGTMDVYFDLPANAVNDVRVNYSISGNAFYPDDYTVAYNGVQPLVTSFNGAQGTIVIKKNTSRAVLRIDPVDNSQMEPDKTINITLIDGGDYKQGGASGVTATITNDDVATIYNFTGDGNFNTPGNWQNGKMPPSILLEGDEIVIDPAGTGICVLNVPLTLKPGAKLTVKSNKRLMINGNLKLSDIR